LYPFLELLKARRILVDSIISTLKGCNYTQPLRIEDLAEPANMSTTSFHNHFRSITAFSPLQFQKQLRLQEARRLMLSEGMDAANAAFQVGYESPSQFSRNLNDHVGRNGCTAVRMLLL
jgi:AraC-like DNA-binding protein